MISYSLALGAKHPSANPGRSYASLFPYFDLEPIFNHYPPRLTPPTYPLPLSSTKIMGSDARKNSSKNGILH